MISKSKQAGASVNSESNLKFPNFFAKVNQKIEKLQFRIKFSRKWL